MKNKIARSTTRFWLPASFALFVLALQAGASVAESPQIRYVPRTTGEMEDFGLGPAGDLVVTYSSQGRHH